MKRQAREEREARLRRENQAPESAGESTARPPDQKESPPKRPTPADDAPNTTKATDAAQDSEARRPRSTTQKSGHLVDGPPGSGGAPKRNHSTDIDLSNLSKGKVDVAHNFDLGSIRTTVPLLGVAGGSKAVGMFIELGASAGIKANAGVDIPPDKAAWSATVDGGLGASANLALKAGVQLDAGPANVEATVAGTASLNATSKVGVKVSGEGERWQVDGLATGLSADLSASVGIAATLQAGVGSLSAGQTFPIAGPYVLPLLQATYPTEGKATFAVSPQVKALPAKISAGLSSVQAKVAAAAKEAANSGADAITGLDEESARDDAQRESQLGGADTGASNWRIIKQKLGVPRLRRWMSKAEINELNALGDKYISTFAWHKANEAAGLDDGWWETCQGCRKSAAQLMHRVRTRIQAKQEHTNKLDKAKGQLRQSIQQMAKAHANMSYHARKAHEERGVARPQLSRHFDPGNNAYMPLYRQATQAVRTAADAADCEAMQRRVQALTATMREGAQRMRSM